jgi:hypothetical protein
MTLLEQVNYPAKFDRILVACSHYPEGRHILVRDIIGSKHCCHTGNARSQEGRKQRSATLSSTWDDLSKRVSLLRNNSGHRGSELTKLYICRVKTKDGSSVLKLGRSERGAKRYGSFLAEELWDCEIETSKARLIELYTHLRFSDYLLEDVELNTSGFTECYHESLPIDEVIRFIQQSISEVKLPQLQKRA